MNITVTSDNKILLENDVIGHIESGECCLRNIEIIKRYRGSGYGHEAFRIWFEEKKKECDKITTTAVTSHRMESILKDFGFKKKQDNHFIWKC